MNAINTIRQWCSGKGYSFCYGNPMDVNRWMTETDFSSSTDSTAVFIYLLTTSEYDGSKDSYNVGIYFAELCDLDFNNQTIDTTTEALKERAKALLTDLSQGNAVGWSGARFTYGYDDYAENVVWCCMRVTLTALASECVEMPTPEPTYIAVPLYGKQELDSWGVGDAVIRDGIATLYSSDYGVWVLTAIVFPIQYVSEAQMTMTINGNTTTKQLTSTQITETLAQNYPSLADYVGWWMFVADGELETQDTSICVECEIDGCWSSGEICWEEA